MVTFKACLNSRQFKFVVSNMETCFLKKLVVIFSLLMLSACVTTGVKNTSAPVVVEKVKSFEPVRNTTERDNDLLNQRISQLGAAQTITGDDEYLLGSGDVIEITVFQVKELNKQVRVNGKGTIILPLVGSVDVLGKSVAQVEEDLKEKLARDFLQDPQVGIFISEYRSQQITVMGAVQQPNVYNVRKSRSIFEMLSMAGGITEKASDKLRVRLNRKDEFGQLKQINLVLSMDEMLKGSEQAHSLRLNGGDSVLVPDAGVVFVEGAVNKPGAFKLEGDVNVVKAIALAGGIPWEAKSKSVQVVRQVNGEPVAVSVDVDAIKEQKEEDVLLQDGDIVVIGYDVRKRAFSGFFKTFGSIFGYSLN